ncbi:MAG: Pyrroline-5-carboxylate reductase [Pseudomonadota bacterium]
MSIDPSPADLDIGFIGAGNMAGALIRGLLQQGVPAGRIRAADIDATKLEELSRECGIGSGDSRSVTRVSRVLVLAVKPQVMQQVCGGLKADLQPGTLVISIAAGITLAHLQRWLGQETALVRCMPNTPALVGCGASALFAAATVDSRQRTLAQAVLDAVGISLWLTRESDMDAVTALSGSGPAYFFLLMEAMQVAGRELGLDDDTARRLTLQTALGAARLAANSPLDSAELRRQVTSPGGTTERAIGVFEQGGLRELVSKALGAARQRSEELAGTMNESTTKP